MEASAAVMMLNIKIIFTGALVTLASCGLGMFTIGQRGWQRMASLGAIAGSFVMLSSALYLLWVQP
jgi:hypothetical protein